MGCVWTYFLLFLYFLLCWKLTFYCMSHLLLEFHITYSVNFLLFLSSSLQNHMEVTCMQTKVENKSNTNQNTIVMTCTQNKVEIMSNSIKNTMVITCMKKKAKFKSNSIQIAMMVTCMQKWLKIKSSKTPWLSPESRRG